MLSLHSVEKLHPSGQRVKNITFGWCPDDAQDVKLISNILSVQFVWPVRGYLICNADQLTGFYMSVTLAWYGLNLQRKMMFCIFFKLLIRDRYKWAFIRLVAKCCRIFVGTANLQNICNLIGRQECIIGHIEYCDLNIVLLKIKRNDFIYRND